MKYSVVQLNLVGLIFSSTSCLTITEAHKANAICTIKFHVLDLTELRENLSYLIFSSLRVNVLDYKVEELHGSLELVVLL